MLRGRLYCGLCGRKMQAQHNNRRSYYRCRYAREYALAHHVHHPVNVYVREDDVLPAVDSWLRRAGRWPFPAEDRAAVIAGCDAKLARYQAGLDAGADPVTVAGWTKDVTAQRAAALARAAADPADKARIYERLDPRVIGARW